MEWFRSFALNGLHFQAFAIAFGSLVLLVERHRPKPSAQQVRDAHPALRWLLRYPWERWGGWTMISCGLVIAAFKLTR